MSATDRPRHYHDSEVEQDVSDEQRDNTILNVMFCDTSWPWSVDEIARELPVQKNEAESAVARLAAAGLVHRLGEFVFPTRTARRADALGVGTI
jgi:Mn-dependent DtxR family transcriptional regulator